MALPAGLRFTVHGSRPLDQLALFKIAPYDFVERFELLLTPFHLAQWRSQRDSNPRTSLERAVSWASRRMGLALSTNIALNWFDGQGAIPPSG